MSDKDKSPHRKPATMSNERPMSKEQLLEEIQAVGFALVELNLYLNTHPWDQQALGDYNSLAKHYRMLTQEYEYRFGPLYNFGHSISPYPWKWNEPPWPWQM